jgi:pimeloyl-ACP methyl ester carboxylesterase
MIEHEHADIDGIHMHYAVAGRGKGPPVLLLHGFPESSSVWSRVMTELAKDHFVIAPDQRGYGATSRPDGVEAYRIEHLVADIDRLVRHLALDSVHLVGQDWGALVGWSYLLRHPGRVIDFTTIDFTHPALFNEELRTNPEQQKTSEYMLLFRSPAAEAAIADQDYAWPRQSIFDAARALGADLSDEEVEAWLSRLKEPGALTAALNWYRAAEIGPPDGQGHPGGSNVLDGLPPEALHVDTPVLFIRADLDMYLLPSGMDGLHRHCKDVWIRRIAGADHWVSLEKPALVAAYLRDFFGLHGASTKK